MGLTPDEQKIWATTNLSNISEEEKKVSPIFVNNFAYSFVTLIGLQRPGGLADALSLGIFGAVAGFFE